MKVEFNYHSERARKARFSAYYTRTMRGVTAVLVSLLAMGGAAFWITSPPLGALLISAANILLLPLMWYAYDISRIKPNKIEGDNVKIEEVLPPNIVGRLKAINSPYAVWAAIDNTWQYRFMAARYGIGHEIFDYLTKDQIDMRPTWQYAAALSQKHHVDGISPVALLVALVTTMPQYDQILADRKLDVEDLETSVDWLAHTERVIERHHSGGRSGGLARDWTSGYTPFLNQMSHNMSYDVEQAGFMHRDLDSHRATIDQMVKFMADGRQNVLLIGDVGTGKTITTFGFAQRLLKGDNVPTSIKYHQIFLVDPTGIISSSRDPSHVESTVVRIVAEAQKSKNSILFFDDAATFFAQGTGSVDLGKVLMPMIENNVVPMVFAMTPSEWQDVSSRNQSLKGTLNYLAVPEAEKHEAIMILEDQSLLIEARHKVTITYQALEQAYTLSDRYIKDIASPGRSIRLLENSVTHAEQKFVTARSIQRSVEATQGVKVQQATGAEKEQLMSLEDEIHQRMINQDRAVKVVSDALRRARSGVGNPSKPIGTFLFLGPTGVGKTELSKAIADVYFGDANKMVRVDMNEFTQSSDIGRLLDTASSASLLSQIGRNPFTVVLFDEIEKAHPEVVNVFLQLLDEGIMRDSANREVSFRDAIVIGTSNAGADSIRAYIDAGQKVAEFEKPFIDSLIDSNLFKPEFLNRFDETVVFRPLTVEELTQVVDLLLASINANLAKQKVKVVLTPPAKRWLAEQGYDPRLGARPLRRMVQRTVENVVAKKLLTADYVPGTDLTLDVAELSAEEH